jgi:hypothetical protein
MVAHVRVVLEQIEDWTDDFSPTAAVLVTE